MDARDTRDGGWSWFQQELLYFFTPLIGYKAAWLYTSMCHLIPQKIEHPLMDLSMRVISKQSSMAVGTVHREMALLTAAGMIEVTKGDNERASTYRLVSLRKLAALGNDEIVKRLLGVPGWNTSKEYVTYKAARDKADAVAKERAGSADSTRGATDTPAQPATPPAASGTEGVPPGNTSPDQAETPENADETPRTDGRVFQKPGGGVPEKGGSRSRNPGEVFQKPAPKFKERNLDLKTTTPPTPVPGDGGVELILPKDDLRADDAEFPIAIGVAARWVMQQRGLSKRRLQDTIAQQLAMYCRQEEKTLQEAARLAVERHEKYVADAPLLRWVYPDTSKIFVNSFWRTQSLWPYDQAKQRELAEFRAAVGMRQAPARKSEYEWPSVAAFIQENASALEQLGGDVEYVDCAKKLRELASTPMRLDLLDKELTALEEELLDTLMMSATEDELTKWREQAGVRAAEWRGRMNKNQVEKLQQQLVERSLIEARGLPRLSLFYIQSP